LQIDCCNFSAFALLVRRFLDVMTLSKFTVFLLVGMGLINQSNNQRSQTIP
jgi:hypothetical protein